MAFACLLMAVWAEVSRLINKVPHSQQASPKGNQYNTAFFATWVARPMTGHSFANTATSITIVNYSVRTRHWKFTHQSSQLHFDGWWEGRRQRRGWYFQGLAVHTKRPTDVPFSRKATLEFWWIRKDCEQSMCVWETSNNLSHGDREISEHGRCARVKSTPLKYFSFLVRASLLNTQKRFIVPYGTRISAPHINYVQPFIIIIKTNVKY